jgi:uncharacterized membrane protein
MRLPTYLRRSCLGVILVSGLATAPLLSAQTAPPSSLGDEQARLLEVRRRQIELSAARTHLEQTDRLFREQLSSKTELDAARTAVDIAQLNYQMAVLALLNTQPRVSLTEATKLEGSDGRQWVRVRLTNDTPAIDDTQLQILGNFEGRDTFPEALKTRDLRDIFVSVKDTGELGTVNSRTTQRGTTIALPYEERVSELRFGATKTLTFQLLRDVNSVTLAISHRGGRQEIDVELQKAATERPVAVTATQISQEADLGSQATFELRLSRPTVDTRSFKLLVLGLPREVTTSFVDPASGARVSELSFPPGVTQQALNLKVFLPEHATAGIEIDRALEFFAVAAAGSDLPFPTDQPVNQELLRQSLIGFVTLAVIPRGVGKIEITAPTLFSEVTAGETTRAEFILKNTGTRRLDSVRFVLDAPSGWRAEMAPGTLSEVELGASRPVELSVDTPDSVPAGDYEVRVRTESFAFNRPVPSEDKVYRISVKSRVNVLGIIIIVAILIAAVVALIVAGVRLARR